MPYKDPEKAKQQKKEYYLKNKEKLLKYRRNWAKQNKDKRDISNLKHYEKNKDKYRVRGWINQGILFFDYDLLYEIYTDCKYCDYCKCELNICEKSVKCIDHDHSINDYDNVRGILCRSCNIKDVFNTPSYNK